MDNLQFRELFTFAKTTQANSRKPCTNRLKSRSENAFPGPTKFNVLHDFRDMISWIKFQLCQFLGSFLTYPDNIDSLSLSKLEVLVSAQWSQEIDSSLWLETIFGATQFPSVGFSGPNLAGKMLGKL